MDLPLPRAGGKRLRAQVVVVFLAVETEEVSCIRISRRDRIHRQSEEHVSRNLLNGQRCHGGGDLYAVYVAQGERNWKRAALGEYAGAIRLQWRQESAEIVEHGKCGGLRCCVRIVVGCS